MAYIKASLKIFKIVWIDNFWHKGHPWKNGVDQWVLFHASADSGLIF